MVFFKNFVQNFNLNFAEHYLFIFFPQEFQFQNLKSINLSGHESITKLPNLCAPNLESLDLSFCKNLVECHESIGFLDKLQKLRLLSCEKLQNLPSHLTWKSLDTLDILSCTSLDFFSFFFDEWCLMMWFHGLYSYCCKNVVDLQDIIYKLPPTEVLCIYTRKSRDWCGRSIFGKSFAFLDLSNVENLDLSNVGNLIELDFLMKSNYFPVLEHLYLNEINIITIPESIIKFTRLETLGIKCCKYLCEIPRLPQSIRGVYILNSYSLHPQSSNRLLSQVFLSLFHSMLYRNTLFTFSKIHYLICLNLIIANSLENFGNHNKIHLISRIMNLYYLDQRFQNGSIIKVLETPFHSGSVVIIQILFAVLFLNRMNSFGMLLFESP